MKRLFLLLITSILLFHGCTDFLVIYENTKPQLEVIVLDAGLNLVEGAEVQLYSNQEDWFNKENKITSLTSDQNGAVLFTELYESIYYFYAIKDSMDNTTDVSYFEEALNENEIKVIETIIK